VRPLPPGTVTLLFTDIEGSTRLLHELGDAYADVLAEHRRVLREVFARHRGVEVDTQGDAFFYVFERAAEAVAAADDAQAALLNGPVRVRIGVHTGEPLVTSEGYVGVDVHRAARIMSAGHGGQVLVSERTWALLDGDAVLTDLGLHRLKDLGQPEKLFQLGDREFPPLKTLDATNLPVAANPLLGREKELAELIPLLQDGTRLLTITGPGGTGKTRLALQVAAELVGSFADGVFWVPLGALREPGLVLPTISQTIGGHGDLAEHVRDKHLLLLLDNAEHLVGAAPAVGRLATAAPKLRLLVTSRAPLHLGAEREYPLDPLTPSAAGTLFVERAQAVGRRLEPDSTIEAICRRLDGLPLAIELAAARTKVLAPKALLARLEHALPLLTSGAQDAPERQRTLRATIEWSYALLDDDAKRLFARLAVFAGGFSIEAAEKVCDADLDTLTSLVDLSLLKSTGDSRFLMLETIREYAAERLDDAAEAHVVRERHATHFRDVAEAAEGELEGPDQATCLERLEEDRNNFRAALDWSAAVGAAETELRLATALRDVWSTRGPLAEGLQRLEGAIDRARDLLPERRVVAVAAAALGALRTGDHERAERLARELRALAHAIGDTEREVSAQIKLSHAVRSAGRVAEARSLMEEAVSIARDAGDKNSLGHALLNFGALALEQGDFHEAAALSQQSLREGGPVLDARGRAVARLNLAFACVHLGEYERAAATAREALEISLAQGDNYFVAASLETVAAAEVPHDPARAASLLGAAATIWEEVGGEPDDDAVALVRAGVDQATYERAHAEGRTLSRDEVVKLALGRG
jgi:predicted ATPase/class 3 adenylate cyclase